MIPSRTRPSALQACAHNERDRNRTRDYEPACGSFCGEPSDAGAPRCHCRANRVAASASWGRRATGRIGHLRGSRIQRAALRPEPQPMEPCPGPLDHRHRCPRALGMGRGVCGPADHEEGGPTTGGGLAPYGERAEGHSSRLRWRRSTSRRATVLLGSKRNESQRDRSGSLHVFTEDANGQNELFPSTPPLVPECRETDTKA